MKYLYCLKKYENKINLRHTMRVIAIDAGATKVSGGVVEKVNDTTFELVDPAVEIRYQELSLIHI